MNANNLKLPNCPNPQCVSCRSPLHDIRPYRAENPNKRLTLVHCLSVCPKCGHRHIGVRALKPQFTGLKYMSQKFETYTLERKQELEFVAHFLSKGQSKTDVTLFDLANQCPKYVIWFENTLTDPDRIIRGTPSAGMPKTALTMPQGTMICDQRFHDDQETIYTGLVYQASSIEIGQATARQLKDTAADNGTIAWIECFDNPEYQTMWDNKTPSPGNV